MGKSVLPAAVRFQRACPLCYCPIECSVPSHIGWIPLVGAAGFEPATPYSQSRCATRLRYAPTKETSAFTLNCLVDWTGFEPVSPVREADLQSAGLSLSHHQSTKQSKAWNEAGYSRLTAVVLKRFGGSGRI